MKVALLVPLYSDPREAELIERDATPRRDYAELAQALGADLIDASRVDEDEAPVLRPARERLGTAAAHVLWAFRHRYDYDVIFSDAERVGIPLAGMLKCARADTGHVMLAHWLSPRKKAWPLRAGRLHSHIDRIVCRIESQRAVAERLGVPAEKLVVIPKGVDERFWRPLPEVREEPIASSAGLERRDYPTLLAALREMPYRAVLAAASPYFERAGIDSTVPSNVSVERFDFVGLRALYARSRFVVIPLADADFQAGITAVLEAMAMGKAVVLTHTRGMASARLIHHGEHGLFVPPGDPAALRQAMTYLFENPSEAERMGRAARRKVEQTMTLDHLVDGLASVICEVGARARAPGLNT